MGTTPFWLRDRTQEALLLPDIPAQAPLYAGWRVGVATCRPGQEAWLWTWVCSTGAAQTSLGSRTWMASGELRNFLSCTD